MIEKKFISNLFFVILINLLIKPLWIFGIDREVQNVLGAHEYGLFYTLFGFSFLFNIFLDLGITNYNNRNISQNSQLLTKHLSGIFLLRILMFLIYLAITLFLGFLWGYSSYYIKILLILSFNQFLASFTLYLRSNIGALQLFKTDSIISVLDRLILIIICSVLLWGNLTEQRMKLEWFVYAQTISYLITSIVAFIIVIKKAEFLKINWNYPFFIMIIKQSMPFAILVLLMTWYNRIDVIMLERLIPDGTIQTGIYAQAYRLLDGAINMYPFLFAVLLLPIFSKMLKEKANIEELVKISFCLLIVPVLILSISIYFYDIEIMSLLYDDNYKSSAAVLIILMFSFIAISTTYIFGTLLTANGNLKQLIALAIVTIIVNVALNIYLIPKYLALGSAISNLITQSFSALLQIIIATKIFKFSINYKLMFKLILLIIFIIGINYFANNYINLFWIYNFIIAMTVSLVFSLLIRIIDLKQFILIISQRNKGKI